MTRLKRSTGVTWHSFDSRLRSRLNENRGFRAPAGRVSISSAFIFVAVTLPLTPTMGALPEVDSTASSPGASAQPSDPAGQNAQAANDTQRRVRELIYLLRQHRVDARVDEWAAAIRELVQIGRPAVPELLVELEVTNRDETLRALGFTLRAIGDPRSVPALINAIPKTLLPPRSDYGVQVLDPELRAFMLRHHRGSEHDRSVSYNRPVNELLDALSEITGHNEPSNGDDPLRHIFAHGEVDEQAGSRGLFAERNRHWESWWSQHWQDCVTEEVLQSAQLPPRDRDLVEEAGLARFGPLFPTGADVKLGPVIDVELTNGWLLNGLAHLDLDTGRLHQQREGIDESALADRRLSYGIWSDRHGIDVQCYGNLDSEDMHVWLVDDGRWETLEEEVRSGRPLQLGRQAFDDLVPFDKDTRRFKFDELGTFLFTTREGGRGILQAFPGPDTSAKRRIRYRMWGAVPQGIKERVAHAKPDAKNWGPVVTVTLKPPTQDQPFLLDLETGLPRTPPPSLMPANIAPKFWFGDSAEFVDWCRRQGVDLAVNESEVGGVGREPFNILQLIGLDMSPLRVLPESFDEMSLDELKEFKSRWPRLLEYATLTPPLSVQSWPSTFVITTKSGTTGLLQITDTSDNLASITFRYRLARPTESPKQ